jgi:HSP20 family molecular chaperone IbpA
VIEAELPSAKREDVAAELVGNELRITGKINEPERDGTVRRSVLGGRCVAASSNNHPSPRVSTARESRFTNGILPTV